MLNPKCLIKYIGTAKKIQNVDAMFKIVSLESKYNLIQLNINARRCLWRVDG